MSAPAQNPKQTSRWGSLLSGAVAGLESRLDTILAEDDQASARARAAEAKAKQEAAEKAAAEKSRLQPEPGISRNPSRSRPNSRLQDRLAKAVVKGADRPRSNSRTSSDLPSRTASPALGSPALAAELGRTSLDSKVSDTTSEPVPQQLPEKTDGQTAEDAATEELPRASFDAPPSDVATTTPSTSVPIPEINAPSAPSPRTSFDSNPSRPSFDLSTTQVIENEELSPRTISEYETELSSLRKIHDQTLSEHREELHSHLERIDALQSKLTYLSQSLASQAKTAAKSADSNDPLEKKLADKDTQIAALMEEGQNLSKTELKHLNAIKKMRLKATETEKDITSLKQRLSRAEKSIGDTVERAKRAEAAERAAQEKLKIVGRIEKDVDALRAEREEAGLMIGELRRQLSDALARAEEAERRAKSGQLEAERRVTADLREDLENTRIEKKLAEDRFKKEIQEVREDAARQQERAKIVELELRGEITNLETKLELLRTRTEEVSSSATGDSQAKLLRQIETLQSQYAFASENWQGIEGTLTSRVAALEKERDETAKRESDIRRKARDVNSKARRLEDELEAINDRARALEQDLAEQRTQSQKAQARLAQAESAAQEAREAVDREKKMWEADLQQKLDEEKIKWRLELQTNHPDANYLRADSPSAPGSTNRKHSSADPLGIHTRRNLNRTTSNELSLSPMDRMLDQRPSSRKSAQPLRTPEIGTPTRHDSIPHSLSTLNGASMSQTPSITYDHDEGFDNNSSPHRTINDMISVSTVGAGPTVQLVERMSAAVRRLESEKATSKEEMARLAAQRDEAREEVVALMREIEEKRAADERVDKLEKELKEMDERYQTTLEMLGEKSERVEELTIDVADLKKIYRDLVE
ncbi:uncharacterized protein BDZ99DRAFT_411876, partial [Mytilinidion resinicola]